MDLPVDPGIHLPGGDLLTQQRAGTDTSDDVVHGPPFQMAHDQVLAGLHIPGRATPVTSGDGSPGPVGISDRAPESWVAAGPPAQLLVDVGR